MNNTLKQARLDAGLTQNDLADKICVSQQAVQQWEAEKTVPQCDRLLDIARACSTSIINLFPFSDDAKSLIRLFVNYSREWENTTQALHQLPVSNDAERLVKDSAIAYAEAKRKRCDNEMYHELYITEKEYNIYQYWKDNAVRMSSNDDTPFWKCFFPMDYFITTSTFEPLMAGITVAVVQGLLEFEALIGRSNSLSEMYYPEYM